MAVRYIVASGKGVVGKSSVTAGLALALADRGKKVLCIDADALSRSLDMIMNAGEGIVFNWLDLISGSCTPENALNFIGGGNAAVLVPPAGLNEKVTAESFGKMVLLYDSRFDYIFIDLPSGWSEICDFALTAADRALIVATPDPISLRSASATADKISSKIQWTRLIINRFLTEEALSRTQLIPDECVDQTETGLIGVIPEDISIRHMPAGKNLSQSAHSAFRRTAARIDGENIPFKSKFL